MCIFLVKIPWPNWLLSMSFGLVFPHFLLQRLSHHTHLRKKLFLHVILNGYNLKLEYYLDCNCFIGWNWRTGMSFFIKIATKKKYIRFSSYYFRLWNWNYCCCLIVVKHAKSSFYICFLFFAPVAIGRRKNRILEKLLLSSLFSFFLGLCYMCGRFC